MRAAQQGDGIAMAELIERLDPFVGRICGAVALDDGADAAQETWILALRDLPKLRDPRRIRGWLRRIASREAVRVAQRARRGASAGAPAELPEPGDPVLQTSVREVLSRLAPAQRAILVLRELEGLSEAEAAAVLEVEVGTVKSRLSRARAAFRRRWQT